MGDEFNWMQRQVRLGQAVKFLVKCPHPWVSFESQTYYDLDPVFSECIFYVFLLNAMSIVLY